MPRIDAVFLPLNGCFNVFPARKIINHPLGAGRTPANSAGWLLRKLNSFEEKPSIEGKNKLRVFAALANQLFLIRMSTAQSNSERIVVAVRLRPALRGESEDISRHSHDLKEGPPDGPEDENRLLYSVTDKTISARKVYDVSSHTYSFDAFFGPKATNDEVFEHAAKPIVSAALKGFNGTVFAYGMTGSGKTHTMLGSSSDPGIIPQSFGHSETTSTKSNCSIA